MSAIDGDHPVSPLVTTACCLSVSSCLLAIFTWYIFRKHPTMSTTYHRFAVILAFNDILPAICMMLSFKNHTAGCWLQGTFLTYFQLAGMVTIMQMAYTVRFIIRRAKRRSVLWLQAFVSIYVPPLLFCIFALSVTNKGKEGGFVYCWYITKAGSRVPPDVFIWGYFVVLMLSFIACFVTIKDLIYINRESEGSLTEVVDQARKKIGPYIIVFFLSYTLLLFRHIFGSCPVCTLQLISDTLEASQGSMNSIIFMVNSKQIRNLCYDLLHDSVSGTYLALILPLKPRQDVFSSGECADGDQTSGTVEEMESATTRNILHASNFNSSDA